MVLDFQGSLSKIDASLKKTHVDRVDIYTVHKLVLILASFPVKNCKLALRIGTVFLSKVKTTVFP